MKESEVILSERRSHRGWTCVPAWSLGHIPIRVFIVIVLIATLRLVPCVDIKLQRVPCVDIKLRCSLQCQLLFKGVLPTPYRQLEAIPHLGHRFPHTCPFSRLRFIHSVTQVSVSTFY